MRRALLVSPHFPPDSTAGTHRVRLLAPHLAACGWVPTVLTVDPGSYEGELDEVLAASVPDSLRVVRVPAWRVQTARRLGVGDLGLRSWLGLARAASTLLRAARYDVVFITVYPVYPALLGPWLKRRFGIPFVLDYQDPWVGEWGRSVGPGPGGQPDLRSRLSRRVSTWLEPLALRAADAVTAVSEATFAQALERTPGAQPVTTAVLPIGWDAADFDYVGRLPSMPPRWPIEPGTVHVCYVGTLLPAGFATLRAVLAGLVAARQRAAEAARVRVHFFGTSNQRVAEAAPRVLGVARELGLEGVVTEHPPRLDYFDALRVLTDADALLLLGSDEVHYTPSKAYPALLSARRVLAVYHEASPVATLLGQAGRAPSIRLVTHGQAPVTSRVDELAEAWIALARDPDRVNVDIDRRALEPSSAAALARILATVFDRVAGQGGAA